MDSRSFYTIYIFNSFNQLSFEGSLLIYFLNKRSCSEALFIEYFISDSSRQRNAFRCDFDDTRDPDFEPLADAGRSFTDEGDNIFLVKVNRWISL